MRNISATDHPAADDDLYSVAAAIDDRHALPETEIDLSRLEPSSPHDGGDDNFVELKVLLTDEVFGRLEQTSASTGDTKTDVVNRALAMYAAIQTAAATGGGIVTFQSRRGQTHRAIVE